MSIIATTSSRFAARLRPFSGVPLPAEVTPIALAIAVGIVAGFSSIALKELVEGFEDLFFGELGSLIN